MDAIFSPSCLRQLKESSQEIRTKRIQGSIKGIYLEQYAIGVIKAATNNFAHENKLGEGGFARVYKGRFPDGQMVAVKRLSNGSNPSIEVFENEVEVASKLQHRNFVRLLGYCVHEKESLLVFELLPNGSLDAFLFDATKRGTLNWKMRFNIVKEIAGGLVYLHRDSRFRIIHRDVKPHNILLDEQYKPKISDFGTARIFGGDQIEEKTERITGTLGYMAPEYLLAGEVSDKADVFGFGVLVLEILSGRKNNCFLNGEEKDFLGLLRHAWKLWKEGRILELIDPSLGNSYDNSQFLKCIKVGLLCVQESPEDRPTMSEVVSVLNSDTHLPEPKSVADIGRRNTLESSESASVSCVTATETVRVTPVTQTTKKTVRVAPVTQTIRKTRTKNLN